MKNEVKRKNTINKRKKGKKKSSLVEKKMIVAVISIVMIMILIIGTFFLFQNKKAVATKVDNVEFKVESTQIVDSIGQGKDKINAEGSFLVTNIKVKNLGNTVTMIDSYFFKLVSRNKIYSVSDRATVRFNFNEKDSLKDSFFMNELSVGEEKQGFIVFDIPKSVQKDKQLELKLTEKDQNGGVKSKFIQLNK